jgi:hypothetical protein
MLGRGDSHILTRRNVLALAGAGITGWTLNAATADFWDKKPPAEWTSEEIDRLITKSPWAKEVTADYVPRESGGGPAGGQPRSSPRVGMGIPGIGGRSAGGGRGGGRTRGGGASSYKGTVRWESAKPILEAMKAPLPEQFANHYVISVNGLPLLGSREAEDSDSPRRSQDEAFDNLKQFTTLQPKGRDLVQAGLVHRQVSSGSSFLFGFSSELLPLSTDDSEVVFSTRLGQLTARAKFSLKEMLYHRELAL